MSESQVSDCIRQQSRCPHRLLQGRSHRAPLAGEQPLPEQQYGVLSSWLLNVAERLHQLTLRLMQGCQHDLL